MLDHVFSILLYEPDFPQEEQLYYKADVPFSIGHFIQYIIQYNVKQFNKPFSQETFCHVTIGKRHVNNKN